MTKTKDVKIYVAFRFHANLYHSYRADTLDEMGLGKDIRIMRYCLDTLDKLNAKGIPVRGTWDIENYYSLQKNMATLCPDITERIKKRVQDGMDEVELMNYNNGIISAHTEEEAEVAMGWAISNPDGSGLKDIFGKYGKITRPQECMHTPSLVKVYNKLGIEAISIFYSCIAFNGFSSFVPMLSTKERFNPLWYTAPGMEEKMILLPAMNPGDHFENGGITALVRKLRKEQLQMEEPTDLLVLLDMDADDDFWQGYLNTHLSFALGLKKPLVNGGLNIFAQKLAKLPYVEFTTPYEYLKTHEPVGTVCFGQDTADGSHDSYSPWADKLENKKLWSEIERNKLVNEYAKAVCPTEEISQEVSKNIPSRILTMSTTHFGLSTPAMCKPRLLQAFNMIGNERAKSDKILEKAKKLSSYDKSKTYAIYPSTYYKGNQTRNGLIRLSGDVEATGTGISDGFTREVFGKKETVLVYSGKENSIELEKGKLPKKSTVTVSEQSFANDSISLKIEDGQIKAFYNGKAFLDNGSFETYIEYDKATRIATNKQFSITSAKEGNFASIVETGCVNVGDGLDAKYTKTYSIIANLPYVYVDMDIKYPLTKDYGTSKQKVALLYRGYDSRWEEVVPLEIIPAFKGNSSDPIRVYKHNFMGSLSYFDYDYYKYTPNKDLATSNNAITCGFVSFSAKDKGLLIAQSVAADNSFSFTNVRFNRDENKDVDKISINPFGIYHGKQWKYNLTKSGLAMAFATKFAASYLTTATTYRGGQQQFSLMLAPFDGNKPAESTINDAIAFAYPPYVLSENKDIKMIEFTDTKNYEPLD
jgi:hypothetical protein